MNELDAVRAFRAEMPDPSTDSRMLAMGRLQRQMTSPRTRQRWRLAFPRIVLPLSAAVMMLIAAALASPIVGLHGGESNAAASELRMLSYVAAQQPDAPALAAGMFTYTRSENLQMNTAIDAGTGKSTTTLVRYTREIWIGADGSGHIRETGQGLPTGGNTWDEQFGPGGLTPPLETNGFSEAELMKLAQHPDQLAQAIRERAASTKNPVDAETFVLVGDLLRESGAPSQLRAALFQVAAGIPGVDLVGNVQDSAGRSGVSVAMTHNGVRSELIFDRQTSMLLAERQTIVAPVSDLDFPVGTVIGETTYLSSGTVTSTTATP